MHIERHTSYQKAVGWPYKEYIVCNQFKLLLLILLIGAHSTVQAAVFLESKGRVVIEAEHFARNDDQGTPKAWYRTDAKINPALDPDADPRHHYQASGGAYLEGLPDSYQQYYPNNDAPVGQDSQFIEGVNLFQPGTGPLLTYRIKFTTPGRYYVFARMFTTGDEDDSIHVGLNGTWPDSGKTMQMCNPKNQWAWTNARRTNGDHCGTNSRAYLDIPTAGIHRVQFAMREDGAEFDKFILTTDPNQIPKGMGAAESKINARVTGFTLIDADTGGIIGLLTEGMHINLAGMTTHHINIVAEVEGQAGSLRFALNGDPAINIENVLPFSLAGDNPLTGEFAAWTPTPGGHTLIAVPYAGINVEGGQGKRKTIHFMVSTDPNLPPGPTEPLPPTGSTGETLVVEAENFTSNVPKGEHQWQPIQETGTRTTTYMKALPDAGFRYLKNIETQSAMLAYQIEIVQEGHYYVWVRARGSGEDHTIHVGLNGVAQASADRIVIAVDNNWVWSRLTLDCTHAVLNMPVTGQQTLNIWMGEDGFQLDKVVITNDPSYRPAFQTQPLAMQAPSTATLHPQLVMAARPTSHPGNTKRLRYGPESITSRDPNETTDSLSD